MNFLKFLLRLLVRNFKGLVIGVLLILVAIFTYNYIQDRQEKDRLYKELIGKDEKFKKLNDYTGKLESRYRTQKELFEEVKKEFEEALDEANGRIKSITETTFELKKKIRQAEQSDDWSFFNLDGGYFLNEVRIQGEDSPPIGWVLIKKDHSVESGNYLFEIVVKSFEVKDEQTGKIKVFTKAFYVVKESGLAEKREIKDWKDIPYPLPIKGGIIITDPTEQDDSKKNTFIWWAPRFGLGANIGANLNGFIAKPNLTFSTSGYGKSKNDLKFKFVNIGVDFDKSIKNLGVNFKPIMYRPLDIFPNTYLGPGIGYDINDNKSLFLSLEVNF